MQNMRLNNILILTTEDNFYLGKLLLKLNKIKSYKFKYIIINEYSVNKNFIKKILVRILTIGFLNCILFIIRSLIKKTKKKRHFVYIR